MADGIVINKADGDNLTEARHAATHYRNALRLFPMPESGRRPEVLTYSGLYDIGIKEVWEMIFDYVSHVKSNGVFDARRKRQAKYWMYESINEQLHSRFYNTPGMEELIAACEQELADNRTTSFAAATRLMEHFSGHQP